MRFYRALLFAYACWLTRFTKGDLEEALVRAGTLVGMLFILNLLAATEIWRWLTGGEICFARPHFATDPILLLVLLAQLVLCLASVRRIKLEGASMTARWPRVVAIIYLAATLVVLVAAFTVLPGR